MNATITRLAVGRPRVVSHRGNEVATGIFKSPVAGRLRVTRLNIDGDGQADLAVHGGRDKAVYVYPESHYADWAAELGRAALEPAQFGENLTVSGLDEEGVVIGDAYRVGSVSVVVAQPRLPCFKLGIRMNDDKFPARFLQSGRLGFYLRVEQEGELGVGDSFELVARPEHGITVADLWRTVFRPGAAPAEVRRCLDLLPHLDEGWVRRLKNLAPAR